MKTPAFWYRDGFSVWSLIAAPLGWLYAAATARRVRRSASLIPVKPVICIGNINAGGTGKTPTVIAVAQRLQQHGQNVQIVTRGYGGSLEGPVKVSERRHKADDVGDEPLLLAAFAPTWVAKDRAAGVSAATADGADLILLDDGFQNPAVQKALSVVVVDASQGFGNGRCIPAGPLREPVDQGLKRADFVLSIGDADDQTTFEHRWGGQIATMRLRGHLAPLETGIDWNGMRVLAFAGIGNPAKFFKTLRRLGVELVQAQALEDHQALPASLLIRLEAEARLRNAQLVTTEKDAVRLPSAFQQKVLTVPVRLELDDWSELDRAIKGLLSTPSSP